MEWAEHIQFIYTAIVTVLPVIPTVAGFFYLRAQHFPVYVTVLAVCAIYLVICFLAIYLVGALVTRHLLQQNGQGAIPAVSAPGLAISPDAPAVARSSVSTVNDSEGDAESEKNRLLADNRAWEQRGKEYANQLVSAHADVKRLEKAAADYKSQMESEVNSLKQAVTLLRKPITFTAKHEEADDQGVVISLHGSFLLRDPFDPMRRNYTSFDVVTCVVTDPSGTDSKRDAIDIPDRNDGPVFFTGTISVTYPEGFVSGYAPVQLPLAPGIYKVKWIIFRRYDRMVLLESNPPLVISDEFPVDARSV